MVLHNRRLQALLIAGGVMAAVVVFVIGFSHAMFTATTSGPENLLSTGELRLSVSPTGPVVSGTGALKPGDTRTGTVKVKNVSSKAKVRLSAIDLTEGAAPKLSERDRADGARDRAGHGAALPRLDRRAQRAGARHLGKRGAAHLRDRDRLAEHGDGQRAAGQAGRVQVRVVRGVRVFRVLSVIGLVCVLLVAGLMLVPTILGYQRYVLVSGSMTPTIPTGSIVYDEVVPVADLAVGDVITFVPPPSYGITTPVTHRIYEISKNEEGEQVFRTKGDANDSPDAWEMTLDSDTQARVAHHIEKLGYIYIALSNRWVQLLVIGLPALVIMGLICVALWREAGEAVLREEAEAQAGAGA